MILLEQGRAHCQQCRIHVLKFNFSRIFFLWGSRIYNTKQDGYKWSTWEISNCSLSIIYPCVLEYHFNMPIKKYYTVCCLSGILYCYLLVFKIVKKKTYTCVATKIHVYVHVLCAVFIFVAYFNMSPEIFATQYSVILHIYIGWNIPPFLWDII